MRSVRLTTIAFPSHRTNSSPRAGKRREVSTRMRSPERSSGAMASLSTLRIRRPAGVGVGFVAHESAGKLPGRAVRERWIGDAVEVRASVDGNLGGRDEEGCSPRYRSVCVRGAGGGRVSC